MPRTLFQHLKGKLNDCGFNQSPNDVCLLFYINHAVCVLHVDNYLFFSPSNEAIEGIFEKMRPAEVGLDFHIEDNVVGFLVVLMTPLQEDGMIELTQTGLIDGIITGMKPDDANVANALRLIWCPRKR